MRLGDGRVVPNFVGQALHGQPLTVYGDGSQTRSFCYVDDLVEGVYRLLMSEYALPVNIGNPREMTILELAETVLEMTGSKAGLAFEDRRIEGDPQTRRPDITRARQVLGWEPKIDLKEGLHRAIEYYRGRV
jgi:dTDP-glucose 4,6-dehydratase